MDSLRSTLSRCGQRWTHDEKDRLRRMFKKGCSQEEMAALLSRDVPGVFRQLCLLNLISQADLDERRAAAQRKFRRERHQIRKMHKKGCTVDEMAADLAQPPDVILAMLEQLELISSATYTRRLNKLRAREAEAREAEIRRVQQQPIALRPIPIRADRDERDGFWAEGDYFRWDDLGEDVGPRFATAKQREWMLKFPCVYCEGPATDVDHIRPHSKGGTNDDTNLVPACARCNNKLKGDLTPLEAGMPFKCVPPWINRRDLKGLAMVATRRSVRR